MLHEGQLWMDIWWWSDEGEYADKGLSMPFKCWQALVDMNQQIQITMKQKLTSSECYELGSDVFVIMKSPLIDIRYQQKLAKGVLTPERRGITLNVVQFNKLMDYAKVIDQILNSLPYSAQI